MFPYPSPGDYNPYYETYISTIPAQTDVLELLREQQQKLEQLLGRVSEGEADFAYAPDKWSIKQLLGHMNDTERIMAYRALCIARGEQTSLPGFDENTYVANANFERRTLESLISEHQMIRAATISLFHSFSEEALLRRGSANNSPVTVSALAYIIAGHDRHHMNILKERYLAKI